jgi:hypothetical protein
MSAMSAWPQTSRTSLDCDQFRSEGRSTSLVRHGGPAELPEAGHKATHTCLVKQWEVVALKPGRFPKLRLVNRYRQADPPLPFEKLSVPSLRITTL